MAIQKVTISMPEKIALEVKRAGNVSSYLSHLVHVHFMQANSALIYLKSGGWSNQQLSKAVFRLGYYALDYHAPYFGEIIARYLQPDAIAGEYEAKLEEIRRDPNTALALLTLSEEVIAGDQWVKEELAKEDLDPLPPLVD